MFSISKLLFTAVIVALVVLVLRVRSRSGQVARLVADNPKHTQLARDKLLRSAAYLVLGGMAAASLYFLFSRWQDNASIIEVRVVNSYTGQIQSYRARKGDIETRRFSTLDGRKITLAEVERMELARE